MRVLVSGDREYENGQLIKAILDGIHRDWYQKNFPYSMNQEFVVIEGEARGADTLAKEAAEKLELKVEKYPAKWGEYGKAAGPIRNKQMLDEGQPDVVLCFHDNFEDSKGTKDMAKQAKKAGVPTYIISRY